MLAIVLLFGCGDNGAKPNTQNDPRPIRACFTAYRQAVLNANGSEAADQIDSESLAYYQRIRNLAFDGSAEETKALTFADKMAVLIARHRATAAELETMDGRGLFEHAVNHGWIGKKSIEHSNLGDISIEGNTATGTLLIESKETPMTVKFNRAGDDWKLNLPHMTAAAEKALKQAIAESGQDENEFIVNIIAFTTGQEVRNSIWEPRNFDKRTKFDVMLMNAGEKKIQMLKTVREITGLGLKEAKALVDNTPSVIKQGISRADADLIVKKLNEQGGTAEIK